MEATLPIVVADFVKAGPGVDGAENLVGAERGRGAAVKRCLPIGVVTIQQDHVSGRVSCARRVTELGSRCMIST